MRVGGRKAAATRAAILRSAQALFDKHGFNAVSLDDVMAGAGLTRGGFYKHFNTKGELFAEAVKAALSEFSGQDGEVPCRRDTGGHILETYLSPPQGQGSEGRLMAVLPSDATDADHDVQAAFRLVLEFMISGLSRDEKGQILPRNRAMAIATLCMGGLVLARAVEDPRLADELRSAALEAAQQLRSLKPESRTRELELQA